MTTCTNCGRTVHESFIALADYCPGCNATPFPLDTSNDEIDSYTVPVDPADLLDCDSCQ